MTPPRKTQAQLWRELGAVLWERRLGLFVLCVCVAAVAICGSLFGMALAAGFSGSKALLASLLLTLIGVGVVFAVLGAVRLLWVICSFAVWEISLRVRRYR